MTPWTVALVGCGRAKLHHAAPAGELYTGPLFRSAMRCAESEGAFDEVLILSAKHGALYTHEVIEPYDLALASLSWAKREEWGDRVVEQLAEKLGAGCGPRRSNLCVTFFAPALYIATVLPSIGNYLDAETVEIRTPLAGLGIGKQRGWLKRHTRSAA